MVVFFWRCWRAEKNDEGIIAFRVKCESSAHPFKLVISRGSVIEFSYPPDPRRSAIVNAANEQCLGGGGVDGAINKAGGENLCADRLALPIAKDGGKNLEIRCPSGNAVLTGPNSYGALNVPFVIHAVGPDFRKFAPGELIYGDKLLSSAYHSSLERCKEANLRAVAFSLLSAGIYRGARSLKEVLKIGMETINEYDGYSSLEEVHLCAFTQDEFDTLVQISREIGLKKAK